MSEPASRAALHLYRRLMRYGQNLQLTDKDYYFQRVRKEFRRNRKLSDPEQIQFNLKAKPFLPITELSNRNMISKATLRLQLIQLRQFVSSAKSFIDRSKVPKLDEKDLEEQFVRGSGPGGQVVNKTANAVVLRHIPTNLIVKCHAHRMMDQNRKEARKLMITKLDNFLNKEQSVESQELQLQKRKTAEAMRKRKKSEEMKKQWKEREESERKDVLS